jgi:hypothetical protein
MEAPRPPVVPRLKSKVFAVWCEDATGSEGPRKAHLDGHLNYVERFHDRYLVAGPMRRGDTPALVGSLFVVTAADEADARAFLNGDPYFSQGVFGAVTIRAFTPAAGAWMGGVIWESPEELRAVADGGR